jgi:hypothetical protein
MRRRNICKLLIDKPFRVHTARKCTESTMTSVRDRAKAGADDRATAERAMRHLKCAHGFRSWAGDLRPSTSNCSARPKPAGLAMRPRS